MKFRWYSLLLAGVNNGVHIYSSNWLSLGFIES